MEEKIKDAPDGVRMRPPPKMKSTVHLDMITIVVARRTKRDVMADEDYQDSGDIMSFAMRCGPAMSAWKDDLMGGLLEMADKTWAGGEAGTDEVLCWWNFMNAKGQRSFVQIKNEDDLEKRLDWCRIALADRAKGLWLFLVPKEMAVMEA